MLGLAALAAVVALAGCGGNDSGRAERPAAADDLRLAALGDSFTSAPGVPTMEPGNGCMRSDGNYPSLVARELGADLDDASCGSATNDAAWSRQPGVQPEPEPQLFAVTEDTDLVTVSLGLNDLSFYYDMVITCPVLTLSDPTGAPCTAADQASPYGTLLARLPAIQERLERTLRGVRERAPETRVMVVGYPQLVPPRGTCPQLPLSARDYPLFRTAFEQLAQTMAAAAAEVGAEFVDVLAASDGHDICSAQPWVNGALAAPDATAYHPFPAEQEAIAEMVLEAYRAR